MNILSLFDGMSCGQIALNRAGVKYDNYFASEIDKYAITVTQKNFPKTIQVGDVVAIQAKSLPKIDLLIGGSPCQGFSISGNQLNFEDPRSKLFFEYVRLLEECKPRYFLLENVRMKKEYQNIISNILNVQPIMINSMLVSAQNRKRLYWTNIPNVTQPKDKKIYLKDILEEGVVNRNKSYNIDADYFKDGNLKQYYEKKQKQLVFNKPFRIQTCGNGGQGQRVYAVEGKSVTLSALGGGWGAKTGLYAIRNKSKTVRSGGRRSRDKHKWDSVDDFHIRKLTPIECERLQTLPDNYTEGVSRTQRYKMLGNGWTVDVIAHIFRGLPNESL